MFRLSILARLIIGPVGTPVAQRTAFGWILTCSSGDLRTTTSRICQIATSLSEAAVDMLLQQFWELESMPLPDRESYQELLLQARHQDP